MTDVVVHLESAALRCRRFAARLGRSLYRAMIARGTRRALDELPDSILRDIGLTRSDIPFVAVAFASGDRDPTRAALDRFIQVVAERDAAVRWREADLFCDENRAAGDHYDRRLRAEITARTHRVGFPSGAMVQR